LIRLFAGLGLASELKVPSPETRQGRDGGSP
jgi:hypothetical protein